MHLSSPSNPGAIINSLRDRIQQCTQAALTCGALEPIETNHTFVEEGGQQFLVRILANVTRKVEVTQTRRQKDPNFNPFLPYDPALCVGELSPTHVCLLNKFNVVDDHILLVTRAFESQRNWLTLADFEALAYGLTQIDGLGFYNGGEAAGASQPHKHLQLVPFPLLPDGAPLPIEQAIAPLPLKAPTLNPIPHLPFRHALIKLPENRNAVQLQAAYHQALIAVGLVDSAAAVQGEQTGAYNLLVTRRWLFLVPRQQDECEGISVNSLGFAGTLFVKNAEQQARLAAIGPMELLKNVAIALD